MVVLNKIYTRAGDDGTSALANGERRSKFDIRFIAIGEVDEANACVGLARVEVSRPSGAMDASLAAIQNDLFDLGADLAVPETEDGDNRDRLRMTAGQVRSLEIGIDAMNEGMDPLRSFVLPGGCEAAARLHLARTVVRRAERAVFKLAQDEPVNEYCLQYLNRLSDFLFVAARLANRQANGDVLWVPGRNR
jgi:cob(I)alamin adenosyltransferase